MKFHIKVYFSTLHKRYPGNVECLGTNCQNWPAGPVKSQIVYRHYFFELAFQTCQLGGGMHCIILMDL